MNSLFRMNIILLCFLTYLLDFGECSCGTNLTDEQIWFDGPWNYYDIGPDMWSYYCPNYCNSSWQTQSPIDINTNGATPITVNGYSSFFDIWQWDTHTSWRVSNNGHSLSITATNTNEPVATLNSVHREDGYEYKLHGLHFHWSNTSGVGSEHLIDGGSYPLEMHFVHYRSNFGNIGAAIDDNSESNAAAVGFFFNLVSEEEENMYLNKLLDNITLISNYDTSMEITDLNFYDLLMHGTSDINDFNQFWYYEGSLTTPPCDPIVRWFVIKNTLKVSQRQLDRFPMLFDTEGKQLHENYRHVQDNINTVYHITLNGIETTDQPGDSSAFVNNICLSFYIFSAFVIYIIL